jgi:guanylate kinase
MAESAQGVILYGPPASGKDTVTGELARIDGRYRLFCRLKCGPGRTTGYRMISPEEMSILRARPGEVLWETRRYGAAYLVDRSELERQLRNDEIPVVHLGQIGGVSAVADAFPSARMIVAALTCPRDVAAARITARHTGDTAARLDAYDATELLLGADITIDTSEVPAYEAAAMIDCAIRKIGESPIPRRNG